MPKDISRRDESLPPYRTDARPGEAAGPSSRTSQAVHDGRLRPGANPRGTRPAQPKPAPSANGSAASARCARSTCATSPTAPRSACATSRRWRTTASTCCPRASSPRASSANTPATSASRPTRSSTTTSRSISRKAEEPGDTTLAGAVRSDEGGAGPGLFLLLAGCSSWRSSPLALAERRRPAGRTSPRRPPRRAGRSPSRSRRSAPPPPPRRPRPGAARGHPRLLRRVLGEGGDGRQEPRSRRSMSRESRCSSRPRSASSCGSGTRDVEAYPDQRYPFGANDDQRVDFVIDLETVRALRGRRRGR